MEKHTNTKDQFYLKARNDLECKRVCQRVSDERRGLKTSLPKANSSVNVITLFLLP